MIKTEITRIVIETFLLQPHADKVQKLKGPGTEIAIICYALRGMHH